MFLKTPHGSTDVRVVASDLDRTLTDSRLRVVPLAMHHLCHVRALDVRTVLLTGRTVPEVTRRTPRLGDFDHAIIESGTTVYENGIVTGLPSDSHNLKELRGWLDARGILKRTGRASLSVSAHDEGALRKFPGLSNLTIQKNQDRLDITPSGYGKGSGLRHVLNRLQIPSTACVMFGDAENDLSAFGVAGYCVAVGNAEPIVKRSADEVAPGHGGRAVAKFLRQRLLGGDKSGHTK